MSVVDPSSYDYVDLSEAKQRAASQPVNRVIRLASRALAAADSLKNQEIGEVSGAYLAWQAGGRYQKGEIVTDPADGRQYIVVQTVQALEACPPHAEGMLAIYRPVPVMQADGSCTFVYGQNVFAGDVCRDANGAAWIALKDMLPCTWPPQEGNEWQQQDNTDPDGSPAEWVQPAGAHDAYMIGDRVSYNGKVWSSTIDGNVYEPGVYGWLEEGVEV